MRQSEGLSNVAQEMMAGGCVESRVKCVSRPDLPSACSQVVGASVSSLVDRKDSAWKNPLVEGPFTTPLRQKSSHGWERAR